MNDRQRIEAGIIPALIVGVLRPMVKDQETEEEKRIYTLIIAAAEAALYDPVRDLPESIRPKIGRRTGREYLALA